MGTKTVTQPPVSPGADRSAELLEQYARGPIRLAGTDNAFYERHLLFDNVINLAAATPRDQFEAFARSIRDVLSQRWILTETTYERLNPKRLYYLSMEFLIGRSLANNVTNLLLNPQAKETIRNKNINWIDLLEQEPDAGLGNGGLARLAACFLESAATMQLPAMGYGPRYEYNPQWHYQNEPETRAALDLIFSDHFSLNEPGVFDPLRDVLLTHGDFYMHLADLKSYLEADRGLIELYADRNAWARKAILNVASSGNFSSDRTIAQYAADIWRVEPCPVP